MALSQRLDLRQGQSLVMTPQLQQAIKLLQMSNIELQEFVEQELEQNPLLERDERGQTEVLQTAEPQEVPVEGIDRELASDTQRDHPDSADLDPYTGERQAGVAAGTIEGPSDSNWASVKGTGGGSFEGDDHDFGSTLSRAQTLSEHLTVQLCLSIVNPADRLIGQHLIGMVNEAGYLTASLDDIAAQLGTHTSHVDRVLSTLKSFEPTGVFAADLRECLVMQLQERDRYDPVMQKLVDRLDLVAKRDFAKLMAECKVDMEDIREMIAEIRTLNPKPGHAFGADPVQPVIPDVFVREDQDGSWRVELNNDTLPRLLISNQYMAKVSPQANTEDQLYVSQAHGNATWLLKSLDQRAKTIMKVAREIVRQQDGFLVHGVKHLRPINLKTIAEAIEMHESTVSRVTSNKYMATPRGTFEMKYFFTTAIASAEGGDSHSAESVRQTIKDMIQAETAEDILSDDALVAVLRTKGVDIARRTVAKYRESLNIPSSIQRRRIAHSNLR